MLIPLVRRFSHDERIVWVLRDLAAIIEGERRDPSEDERGERGIRMSANALGPLFSVCLPYTDRPQTQTSLFQRRTKRREQKKIIGPRRDGMKIPAVLDGVE